MKAALVIMAAGLGSRYGGNKQVDGVGPDGEILMEYSIYDAIRAGFTKIVFVIKPGMEEMMRRICGDYVARRTAADGSVVAVCYAVTMLPAVPLPTVPLWRSATRCRILPVCPAFIPSRPSGRNPSERSTLFYAPGAM